MLSKFTFYRKKKTTNPYPQLDFDPAPANFSYFVAKNRAARLFCQHRPLIQCFLWPILQPFIQCFLQHSPQPIDPSSNAPPSASSSALSSNTSSPSSGEASPWSEYSADASGIRVLAALEPTAAANRKGRNSRNRIHSTPAPVLDSGSHPASRRPS